VFYDEYGHCCLRFSVRLPFVLRSFRHCFCVRSLSGQMNGYSICATMICGWCRPSVRMKTFFRPAATIFSLRPTIYLRHWCGSSSASDHHSGFQSCARRIRTATSFCHCYDYWTSWLQPYESSV
jgi:hypothetical protein